MFEQDRPLNALEREIFEPYFAKIVLDGARIVDGSVPFWLSRNMCAVVLGHRIYLRAGHYQPNTRRGVELLGHELTHVSQYLHGMTILKYLWSCRNGYYKSVYEMEAYAKGRMIANNYLLATAMKDPVLS
jgi:hypothetical protein